MLAYFFPRCVGSGCVGCSHVRDLKFGGYLLLAVFAEVSVLHEESLSAWLELRRGVYRVPFNTNKGLICGIETVHSPFLFLFSKSNK